MSRCFGVMYWKHLPSCVSTQHMGPLAPLLTPSATLLPASLLESQNIQSCEVALATEAPWEFVPCPEHGDAWHHTGLAPGVNFTFLMVLRGWVTYHGNNSNNSCGQDLEGFLPDLCPPDSQVLACLTAQTKAPRGASRYWLVITMPRSKTYPFPILHLCSFAKSPLPPKKNLIIKNEQNHNVFSPDSSNSGNSL